VQDDVHGERQPAARISAGHPTLRSCARMPATGVPGRARRAS
jgi:hypothetical protein